MGTLAACGGAAPPPSQPDRAEAEVAAAAPAAKEGGEAAEGEGGKKEEDAAAEASRQIPTTCERGNECLPPVAFVKRLCSGFHPDVALTLFAKGSPFTRGYLTRDTDAVNASGGSSSNDKLLFDEEVLEILYHREPETGGMVVSGAGGGYEVLRWDGTCATLMAEEVRQHVPPKPKFAAIRGRASTRRRATRSWPTRRRASSSSSGRESARARRWGRSPRSARRSTSRWRRR